MSLESAFWTIRLDESEGLITDINSIDNSHLTDGIFSVESLVQTGEEGYLQNHDALKDLKVEQVGVICINPNIASLLAFGVQMVNR